MNKKFIIKNSKNKDSEVYYCQAVVGSAILKMDWSISNFGFGEFYCYMKNGQILVDNECVSRDVVEQVFGCGFYNMFNPLEDSVELKEKIVDYEFVRNEFFVKKGDFQVYYAIDEFTENGEILCYEFWSGLSKKFVIEVKKFPEFEVDDGHMSFSTLLNKGVWKDYFISAKFIEIEVSWGNKIKSEDKVLEDCSLTYNEISKETHIAYKFKGDDRYSFSMIKPNVKSNITEICDFPHSRDMLAQIGLFIGKNIKMTD